jgi:hypothetical protein
VSVAVREGAVAVNVPGDGATPQDASYATPQDASYATPQDAS